MNELVVLSLNSGSSSLKFGVHKVAASEVESLLTGSVTAADSNEAVRQISELLASAERPAPQAIGHRVVHGGLMLRQHCVIDEQVMLQLEAAVPFAPLHVPVSLSLIRSARAAWPSLPHAACFDTTFHGTLPDVARVLPIDRALQAKGVQRYGFHGLSCASIVQQLGSCIPARVVIAHLGHGASITAVRDGASIDTSMGLSPSGGVMMGTRSGDIDPGLLIYLLREQGYDAQSLDNLINLRSGLLGVSDISSDLRVLHQASVSSEAARLAIAMFCMSVRKQIAAMAAVLGGVDLIILTGGIGEHDLAVRTRLYLDLLWLNAAVRVMPSQESAQIARHTASLCRHPASDVESADWSSASVAPWQVNAQIAEVRPRLIGD